MRTMEEIVKRIEWLRNDGSSFGFGVEALAVYLDYEHVKPYLKDGVTEGQWTLIPPTEEAAKNAIVGYMPFALDKADSHRGLSAGRSVDKMTEWLWLLDDTETLAGVEYEMYGAPMLKAICDKYCPEIWEENKTPELELMLTGECSDY